MKWAGIVCILSFFMIFVTIITLGGASRLFRAAPTLRPYETPFIVFLLLLFPLGIVLLICGVRTSRRRKEKAIKKELEIGILKEGEIKKNPGIATVLSFFLCGLGQLYNGQILKGILYMIFYGILVALAIAFLYAGIHLLYFLYLIPSITLWIVGLIDANKTARRINVQLDYLKQKKEDLTTKKTNLCADCWFSGDCEKEKKAIKKRKMITNCESYIPKSK